jgi:hypothetical protein
MIENDQFSLRKECLEEEAAAPHSTAVKRPLDWIGGVSLLLSPLSARYCFSFTLPSQSRHAWAFAQLCQRNTKSPNRI